MLNRYTRLFVVTAVLIFAQAVLLNHLRLFHYFLPIVYLYGFLKMPYQSERWIMTLCGALAGFVLDLLMNTPGLNMAATTVAIYLRNPILRGLISEETLDESEGVLLPGISTLKPLPYLLYLLLTTLIHIAALMLFEALSVQLFVDVIPHIAGATAISTLLYLLFDTLSYRRKE